MPACWAEACMPKTALSHTYTSPYHDLLCKHQPIRHIKQTFSTPQYYTPARSIIGPTSTVSCQCYRGSNS